MPFSRGSSQPRNLLHCRQILYRLHYQGSCIRYVGAFSFNLAQHLRLCLALLLSVLHQSISASTLLTFGGRIPYDCGVCPPLQQQMWPLRTRRQLHPSSTSIDNWECLHTLLNVLRGSKWSPVENFCLSELTPAALINMKVKVVKVLVTQSCPSLCNPMDCNLPSSSAHGILQARILE